MIPSVRRGTLAVWWCLGTTMVSAQTRDSTRRASVPTSTPPGMVKPKLPPTLPVPSTYAALFAERDGRARAAMGYIACMQETVNALRAGALGAVPREWSIACMQQGPEWRGVFGELSDDAPGFVVHLQYATRRRTAINGPLDTALAGGVARALFRGLSSPLTAIETFQVIPVILPQATFIEVWFLPVPSSPSHFIVGGDSLIQMKRDGVRELGHAREGKSFRVLASPANGAAWVIDSAEERIPLLSELVAARQAIERAAAVTVRTRQYDAVLTRVGSNAPVWKHIRR